MRRLGQFFLHAGIWLGLGLIAFVYFQRQEAPPVQTLGADHIELSRSRDGHYHLDGRIDGKDLRFLVDTGASTVSVSRLTAERIGLLCQRPTQFQTANGTVQGCITRVRELSFGPFVLRDLSVAILPQLAGEALLGMNALKGVRMEQAGDRLRLSRP